MVSFSVGSAAEFVFNSIQSMQGSSYVELRSGDALVFGGPCRMIYHGVRRVFPNTAPAELLRRSRLRDGRLNLTIRQYIPDKKN